MSSSVADGPVVAGDRPWYRVWPEHIGRSLHYPRVPAWWLVERNVARFGHRAALCDVDHDTLTQRRVLSYAEFWRAARGVAAGLRACGLAPGARVALVLPNGSALVIGYYAAWWAGGVVVPANPAAREPELARQLADAGVTLVVGAAHGAAQRVAERLRVTFLDAEAVHDMESLAPMSAAACDPERDVAVLLYTGGTTGVPKGAMLTHRNIVANTLQFATWYAFAPGEEVSLAALPMFHSGGMSGVMNVPLSVAGTVVCFARFRPAAVARAVTRYRATRLFGVPAMFIALLSDAEARRADYSGLRACRTNAAPLPPTVKAAFDTLVGRQVLVEGYGLTESSPLTHANPIGRAKAGSIGVPLPDTDARIVDLQTAGDGVPGPVQTAGDGVPGPVETAGDGVPRAPVGELLIRGPQVMRGYWNRPHDTAEALRDGWLRTGDVASMDDEGYFAIVDRKKDVINTAGFKVWPREVEEALYAHPAVELAAVVGVRDDYRGEAVKACIVLRPDYRGRVDPRDIVDFCAVRLSSYKIPRQIEFRDALPTSAAGKILRRALRDEGEPQTPPAGA